MDLMDFQAMQAGFPHVFPTDSKELSSTQKLDSEKHQCDLIQFSPVSRSRLKSFPTSLISSILMRVDR